MNFKYSGWMRSLMVILVIVLAVLGLTYAGISAQSPTATITATTTVTATPTPTATVSPPTPSPTSTAEATPSATVTASPIVSNWTPPTLSAASLPDDLSAIVAKVLPSVVSISLQVSTTDIFGQSITDQGAGSGWIIDSNGLIVTNAHVVEGATDIQVSLSDGRVFPAQQISADAISDLAVIKIDATGLPAVTLGDSTKLKQGMMAIAIGNALGQGITVTAGWVSRLNVSLSVPSTSGASVSTLLDLIEISTPINPGNSGGPLIDMLGEVVGITNIKLVQTGVENVGYAISTNTALPVLQQLIQNGTVTRPYMGVGLHDVDATIASLYGLAVDQGALITQVDSTGPASQAGLQPGDVIVGIDNTAITSAADAVQSIYNSQVGQTVTITYYRGSTQATAQVTLIQNPNQ